MKCWACEANLIWGGDQHIEGSEDFAIETNLSCPDCHAFVLFFHPLEQADPDGGDDLNVPQLVNTLRVVGLEVMTEVPKAKGRKKQ